MRRSEATIYLNFVVMSVDQALNDAEKEFAKVVNHLKEEFARLQVGRASPLLVEHVLVEMYGSTQPLKAVAGINIPDARTIQIQPWDRGSLGPIEKSIIAANLGLNPVNDGVCIRINIPPLTEERRTQLTKTVKKLAEDARISVRNGRQDAHNTFKKMKEDKIITEDYVHSADKDLQAKVDKVNKDIDELCKTKEQDVMTI